MEFVMNKIMSIDKDAESYRKGINELLKEKEKELENIIKNMKVDWQGESKNIKDSILKKTVTEAELRAESIRKEKEEQLISINSKYQRNKSKIVDEVFNRIIGSL